MQKIPECIPPTFKFMDELNIYKEILYYKNRVVILFQDRERILKKIHARH